MCNVLQIIDLVAEYALVVKYGARFRVVRKLNWKGRTAALAVELGLEYSTSIYNIEKQLKVPNLTTIAEHAKALGCQPWQLLEGVETEFDLARQLNNLPEAQASKEWAALIRATTRQRTPAELAAKRKAETLARETEHLIRRKRGQ